MLWLQLLLLSQYQILQYNQNLIFVLLDSVIDLIFLSAPIIPVISSLHVDFNLLISILATACN